MWTRKLVRRCASIGFASLVLAFAGCEENAIVGDDRTPSIPDVKFEGTISYRMETEGNGTLIASGTAVNRGTGRVTSPWTIEGQFYTDSKMSTKLGGAATQIGVPLDPGQSVVWTLTYSSSTQDVKPYANFRVGDLRGIY